MIGFIRGVLAEKGSGYIIVDVNGVGYEIFVPANSHAYLSAEGSEVMVYTAMMVREDDVSLYGFMRRGELDAFKKLITVSGVGAKAAISILSSFTMEQLQQAIVFEDAKTLTKASGVGNALSSFKPGDKVQVSVNSQGRVSELRLSNGGKFIRQADGSYQYKK